MPPRNILPYAAFYASVAGLSLGYLWVNRSTLVPKARQATQWLREVSADFAQIHVIEPVKNIYTELVYREHYTLGKPARTCVGFGVWLVGCSDIRYIPAGRQGGDDQAAARALAAAVPEGLRAVAERGQGLDGEPSRCRWHLGCILLEMPAISLLTGTTSRT